MFSQFKELQLIILKHIFGGSVIGFQHCCCFTFMQITLWQHLAAAQYSHTSWRCPVLAQWSNSGSNALLRVTLCFEIYRHFFNSGFNVTNTMVKKSPTSKVYQPSYPCDGYLLLSSFFTKLKSKEIKCKHFTAAVKYTLAFIIIIKTLIYRKKRESRYHLRMLLKVPFLVTPSFIDILRCQPPHCGVVLVKEPRMSREQPTWPVFVVPKTFITSSTAGPLMPICTSC